MKEECGGQLLPVPCLLRWTLPTSSSTSYKDELGRVKGKKEVPPPAFQYAPVCQALETCLADSCDGGGRT